LNQLVFWEKKKLAIHFATRVSNDTAFLGSCVTMQMMQLANAGNDHHLFESDAGEVPERDVDTINSVSDDLPPVFRPVFGNIRYAQ